jgi:hypothetical protein
VKKGDEPAFPQTIDDMGTMRSVTAGLTKRLYIATEAMKAQISNSSLMEQFVKAADGDALKAADYITAASFMFASSMLAHEEKEAKEGE